MADRLPTDTRRIRDRWPTPDVVLAAFQSRFSRPVGWCPGNETRASGPLATQCSRGYFRVKYLVANAEI
jgi:hypothetical protein